MQAPDSVAGYEALYAEAWAGLSRLRTDPLTGPWLLAEATPVLAYGSWQTARVVTAALNPSEDEFQSRGPLRTALPPGQQRLLHWPEDGRLTPARLRAARRLMEGYFQLGHAYWTWFGRYRGLLEALGTPFTSGLACQTNYGSPYTTVVGWGAVRSTAARARLAAEGGLLWRRLLELLPQLDLVVGQGAGWRTVPPLFGFTPADWLPVPTPFDAKGGAAAPRPHLLYQRVVVAGRAVCLVWWRPNRGGPLTWLSDGEAAQLGSIIQSLP
ncbi:MAG TPA: hypothetical protein VM536_15220 [Chloroflexia bacterium]|nr:hypothetical protein [Chloroflexia bacterium]